MRFHRPDSGLGLSGKAVACIKAARKLESLIPLWSVQPAMDLLSERDANEAYVAANKGHAYAVYIPSGGEVRLKVTDVKGTLKLRWINIDTGEFGEDESIKGGQQIMLTSPSKANWCAAVVAQ